MLQLRGCITSGRAMRNQGGNKMALRGKYLTGCAGLALAAMMSCPAFAVDPSRLLSADQNANDWLTNHGSYKSYHYSPADQINAGNVKNLEVAWTHFPERATRGIQSTPLAADGVLYYSGSYSRVYALDGATGKVVWTYAPELDEELVAKQTRSEEHTSELQSLTNLVCRLLLEKKKKRRRSVVSSSM